MLRGDYVVKNEVEGEYSLTYSINALHNDIPYIILGKSLLDKKVYLPRRVLGEGTYGKAVLYDHACSDEALVVKIAKKPLPIDVLKKIRNELNFLQEAYPGRFYALRYYQSLAQSDDPSASSLVADPEFIFILFMPFFKGIPFNRAALQVSSEIEFLNLMSATVQGLQRFHDPLGTLHGDIWGHNIVAEKHGSSNNFTVHFIDFFFGYKMSSSHAPRMADTYEDYDRRHKTWLGLNLPPERTSSYSEPLSSPHPRQDVYSFGKMIIDEVYRKSKEWVIEPENCYSKIKFYSPGIYDLSFQAQSRKAEKRPSLQDFMREITTRRELISHEMKSEEQIHFHIDSSFRMTVWKGSESLQSLKEDVFDDHSGIRIYASNPEPICIKFTSVYGMAYLLRGIHFLRKVYPRSNESTYQAHSLYTHPSRPVDCTYSGLLITPYYADGNDLMIACQQLKTELEWLMLIHAICTELHRIHSLNIIVGNMRNPNILIRRVNETKFEVYFSNFNYGYSLFEMYAVVLNAPHTSHWPPERRRTNYIRPAFNQDFYNLAVILNNIKAVDHLPRYHAPLRAFITSGLDDRPEKRPQDLTPLISTLAKNIASIRAEEKTVKSKETKAEVEDKPSLTIMPTANNSSPPATSPRFFAHPPAPPTATPANIKEKSSCCSCFFS